jgi:hypothetical protein
MKYGDIIYIKKSVNGIPVGYYRFIGGVDYLLEPLFRDSFPFRFSAYREYQDKWRIISGQELKLVMIK